MAMKCQACEIEKKRGQFDTWKPSIAVSFAHRSPTKEEKTVRSQYCVSNSSTLLPACANTQTTHTSARLLSPIHAHTPNRLLSSHCEMLSITCIMPDSLLSGGTQPMSAICYVLCLTHTPHSHSLCVTFTKYQNQPKDSRTAKISTHSKRLRLKNAK